MARVIAFKRQRKKKEKRPDIFYYSKGHNYEQINQKNIL